MISLKTKIKFFLYSLKNPLLLLLAIKCLTRKNIYVEKARVSKKLYYLLKKLYGYQSFSVSTTGALILYYEKYVVKIPLGKVSSESLFENLKNYLALKKSSIQEFVNYELSKEDEYYIMERLKPANISNIEVETIILELSNNTNEVKLKDIQEKVFPNISRLERIIKTKIFLSPDIKIKSCYMHGDLTKDNIMKNQNGDIILIDLDRFTFNGIKGLDYLHYKVDKNSKLQGIDFFDFLKNNNNEDKNFLYLYLLYRICNEYNDGILLNSMYYSKMKKCLEILNPKM